MKELVIKKLVLLVFFCIGIYAFTGEPSPPNVNVVTKPKFNKGRYLIHWESNQGGAYLKIIVYPGYKTPIVINNIESSDYEIDLDRGDSFTISICYKNAYLRPELYLAIYKMTEMNIKTGVYNPDKIQLLYEKEAETNAFGFNGFINKHGGIN